LYREAAFGDARAAVAAVLALLPTEADIRADERAKIAREIEPILMGLSDIVGWAASILDERVADAIVARGSASAGTEQP
jgi:hypothetical protein